MGDPLLLYFAAVHGQKSSLKINDQATDLGGRYWDRTSDLFGVNADWPYLRVLGSVPVCRSAAATCRCGAFCADSSCCVR